MQILSSQVQNIWKMVSIKYSFFLRQVWCTLHCLQHIFIVQRDTRIEEEINENYHFYPHILERIYFIQILAICIILYTLFLGNNKICVFVFRCMYWFLFWRTWTKPIERKKTKTNTLLWAFMKRMYYCFLLWSLTS